MKERERKIERAKEKYKERERERERERGHIDKERERERRWREKGTDIEMNIKEEMFLELQCMHHVITLFAVFASATHVLLKLI